MDHNSITRAFDNANGGLGTKCILVTKDTQKSDSSPIIYMIFQRLAICYKDIYYILIGNEEQVAKAIEKCYEKTEQNKKEDWVSDEIKALETPFDTYCGGHCNTICIPKCKKEKKINVVVIGFTMSLNVKMK